jgi:acetate---CoA ligase (ADP-forming)
MTTSKPVDLTAFFYPKSIAVVGASKDFTSIGGKPLRNLIAHNYSGKIYPVNPKYTEIDGLTCYPSIADIPGEIDLVLLAVSQKLVPSVVQQCQQKGVKFITLFSAGYSEIGDEGAKLQTDLVNYCSQHGIRLCGPNCIGSINVLESIPMGFSNSFETEQYISGNVGLASQSGALGYATFAHAQQQYIGFSYVANTGNQADLTTLEILDFLVADSKTKVITAYLEGIPNGEHLKKIAVDAIEAEKPLIVVKSGRSELGKVAAMSHTGSLAGSEKSFQSFARQYGIQLVNDTDELIDSMKVFSREKRVSGKNVAVISTSGASGILMADYCEEYGLDMTVLSEVTTAKLKEILPSFASVINPVDITAQALNEKQIFQKCLQILVNAPEVDSLVVTTTFGGQLVSSMMEDVAAIDKTTPKPILVNLTGSDELIGSARQLLEKERVPVYDSVSRTTAALKKLLVYSQFLKKRKTRELGQLNVQEIVRKQDLTDELNEHEVKALLSSYQISVPNGKIVTTEAEVSALFHTLQAPLVAKVVSKKILHKSDVGGVVLNIQTEEDALQAFASIHHSVQQKLPNAAIEGILIEEMIASPSLEIIVGVKHDPQFGQMIMCGSGGVYVELLKDVSLRCTPIIYEDAFEMIKELKTYPLFNEFRGGPQYDVEALANALVQVSQLAITYSDEIAEMDINPLIVRPKGQGVVALDGLMVLKVKEHSGSLESVKN